MQQAAPSPVPSTYLSEADWVEGPSEAAVTLVMYADFQCPPCADLALVLRRLRQDFPHDVRRVFRLFPLLERYDKSALAAQAAAAAARQGAFWPMHDRLFAEQAQWATLSLAAFRSYVQRLAADLGLDLPRFLADWEDETTHSWVQSAWENGRALGLPGVPLLFLNGRLYPGPFDYPSLSTIVRLERLAARQFAACPPLLADPNKAYFATLRTERGDVVVQLCPDRAPMAVSSFLFLARQGWYDDTAFFEVQPGRFVRGGDPSETGYGHAGYTFAREVDPELRFDRPGRLALYSDGPESNSSQFLITLAPLPAWDGQYTIFGQVVEGLAVLQALPARTPDRTDAPPPLRLLSVTIEEQP